MIDTYCTLEDVKADLDKQGNRDDNVIQNYLLDAKGFMDLELGYSLGQEDTTTKNYSGDGTELLPIDPILSLTQVLVTFPANSDNVVPIPLDITWDCNLAQTSTKYATTLYRNFDSFAVGRYNIQVVGAWGRRLDTDPIPLEYSRCQRRIAIWMYRARDAQYADAMGTKQTGMVIFHKSIPQDIQEMINRLRPRSFSSRSQLDKPVLHRRSRTFIYG